MPPGNENSELKNVLLIEDDEDYAFLEKDILSEELGITVSIAGSRTEVEQVHLDLYDVIILDFNLPDCTGDELLRLIRRQTDAPVIMVTGQNTLETVIDTLKSGANDYLIKSPDVINRLPAAVVKMYEDYVRRKELAAKERENELVRARVETLGQTLTTLAHYINNSTTTIFGYAQLCQQYPDSLDKAKKLVKISLKETSRITMVLQALDKIVNSMNIRTTNYVNIPDAMFAIEEEIKKQMAGE